jgi:exopolysaccharide biosynthesis polyprenyl glycosylphosphotransferase
MLGKLDKKRISLYFCSVLIINDFFVVIFAFIFSYIFRFYSGLFSLPFGIPSFRHYLFPLIFAEVFLLYIINTRGLYKTVLAKRFIDQAFPLVKSICVTMIFLLAVTFFYRVMTYSRLLFFIIWVNLAIFLILSRYLLYTFYLKKILPKIKKKIILVGRPENLDNLKKHHSYFSYYGRICGYISSRKHSQVQPLIKNLGCLEDFERILDSEKPDEVVLIDLELPRRRVMDMILQSEKRMVIFKIIADLFDIMIQQFELENNDGLNLVKIKESPLNYASNRFLKRSIDLISVAAGLFVLSPFFLIISLLIKWTSPGPVFFGQDRVSEGGRLFRIYKFRTMRQDAEKHTGPVFVKKDDDRCTKIGRFLRKYNFDELPQLFNVFRGEMSLVGPRPERPYFVEQFKHDIPRYMSRHHIKSGLTGWAQVNGLRQSTSIEERIKYDLYYAENWSLWLDLKIIFLSFFALKNAY